MTFKDTPATKDLPPPGDVLVWELDIPAAAVGAFVAICDGYENKLQLRAIETAAPGGFMAWAPPAFRDEIAALLAELGRRYGAAVAGPRPFTITDLGRGITLRPTRADPRGLSPPTS